MITGNRAFEKSLGKQIKKILRADMALWKEFKRNRKRNNAALPKWIFSAVFMTFALARIGASHVDRQVLAIAITLYTFGSAMRQAGAFLQSLFFSHNLMVLSSLPIDDRTYFKMMLRRAFLDSLWTLAFYFLANLAFLSHPAAEYKNLTGLGIAAGLALIQWSTVFGASLLYAAWRPNWRLYLIGLALNACATAIFFLAGESFDAAAKHLWNWQLALPGGWVNWAFDKAVFGREIQYLAFALAPLPILLFVPAALRRMRAYYSLRELSINAQNQMVVVPKVDPRNLQELDRKWEEAYYKEAAGSRALTNDEFAALSGRISNREFLSGSNWSAGPVERIIGSWLTPGERRLMEFLSGDSVAWTSSWKRLAIFLPLTAIVSCTFPKAASIFAIFVFILFRGDLFIGYANLPGLTLVQCASKLIPLYAIYPVGFSAMSRVLIVTNLMRAIAALPIFIGTGVLVAWLYGFPPAIGAMYATKSAALLMAGQPALAAIILLWGSRSMEHITLKTLAVWIPTLIWFAVFAGSSVGMILREDFFVFVFAVVAAVISGIYWLCGRAFYNSAMTDLIRDVQQQPG